MSDAIQADYEQLEQLAGRLTRQAEAVQQTVQQVKSGVETVKVGWAGDAFNAFEAEMRDTVAPASDRLHQALQQAGQTLKEVSQTVKQAEDEASNLIKSSAA